MNGSSGTEQRLDWYQSFAPSTVMFHNIRTGEQVREPSLVALDTTCIGKIQPLPYAAGDVSGPLPMARCRAVGFAALDLQGTPGVAVFSPLRHGQIADYDAAVHLFRELSRRVRPKISVSALLKPILCVHVQEHTTDVETRALIDAGIQTGARRVLLYRDPLPAMLERARSDPKLHNGYILHIDPQD